MKLKITEIEASAEELRQSNSMAEGLARIIRNAFNQYSILTNDSDDDEAEGC